jgi:hypothetical protein
MQPTRKIPDPLPKGRGRRIAPELIPAGDNAILVEYSGKKSFQLRIAGGWFDR